MTSNVECCQNDGELGTPLANRPAITDYSYVPPETKEYPQHIKWLRVHAFKLFLVLSFGGTFITLLVAWFVMKERDDTLLGIPCSHAWKELFKYLSIPVVEIVFTWWHVWLGIQMCFYPVEFKGCCAPVLGWQGIVPRRAHVMATRSCDIMIGTLITIEEIIGRVEVDHFYTELGNALAQTSEQVIHKVATNNWPQLWNHLSSPQYQNVKNELHTKVLEESREMFNPVIEDLKQNINKILDIKQMSIDILVSEKRLLVNMFQEIGHREFTFIQHMSAVMGFICGFLQMLLWLAIKHGSTHECHGVLGSSSYQCWIGLVILPVSGLLIGYFTNWLGITMIFRPVNPHHPRVCRGYVNIQGVFLKRQKQVSEELSKMITKHLVHANKMLEYLITKPDVIDQVLEIYQRHASQAIDEVMKGNIGKIVDFFAPGAVKGIKDEILKETLAELPNHTAEITAFMDKAFDLQNTLATRLAGLRPEKFEGMLHPVFQEDEWMILLLGGVLGVLVGTLQAFALGS